MDGSWVTIMVADIVCLLGGKRCTRIVLQDSEHAVRLSLGDLSFKLDERFARTHRSEIVNVEAVQRLERWTHGDAILEFNNGSTRILTRTYRKEFMERYTMHASQAGSRRTPP